MGAFMQGATYWNGTIWGATKGAALVELQRNGNALIGSFLLMEPGLGTTRAKIVGSWSDDNCIDVGLEQFTSEYSVPMVLPKEGRLHGLFDPSMTVIEGDWQTDAGTSGRFVLVCGPKINPQLTSPNEPKPPAPSIPLPQQPAGPLVTTTINLGAVRLDQDGLANLARIITEGTAIDQPAINACHRGREYIHLGVVSLLNEPSLPGFVDTIIISASEPALQLGQQTVVVRLMQSGPNTVFVSGYNRIWVEGKVRQIEVFLQNYESKIIGFWRKHGGNANGIVFLALLGILPSIPSLFNRFKIIIVVFAFLQGLRLTWTKVVHTRVFLHKELVPFHTKYAEWILTPLAVLSTGIVGYLIQRYVHAAAK
jgi:hypothetical protein